MMQKLKIWWNEKPLTVILLLGFTLRFIAAIFSKGFGFSDDHFLIIEAAQSWIDHVDYDNWLPAANGLPRELGSGHNFFYPGMIYLFFQGLKHIGIVDPQIKMTLLRLLHVPYSMLIVYYGYKITEKLSTQAIAKQVGLILAALWLFPFLSVRNLIEMMCIPPLLCATWLVIRNDKENFSKYFVVGLSLGLAFCFRFQSMLFVGGFGLALFFQRKWIQGIAVGIGFAVCAAIIEGGLDIYVWHRPFVQFMEYINFNMHHAYSFVVLPWYTYILDLLGILVPPISIMFLFGFFRNFRKNVLLFLPSFLFLVFHSMFPNKRERFIIPIVPFVIILGSIGWAQYIVTAKFWQQRKKLVHIFWVVFWCINTIPLLVLTVSYSKRNVVESMSYLYKKGDANALLIENGDTEDEAVLPYYYLGKWVTRYNVNTKLTIDSMYKSYCGLPSSQAPNYVLFITPNDLDKRLNNIRRYHHLTYETTIDPSLIDEIMHFLNPRYNDNPKTFIYKITDYKVPCGNSIRQ